MLKPIPYTEREKQIAEQAREDAIKEHNAMCDTCIHKVSKADIDAIKVDAIDEFIEKAKLHYLGVHPDELHNPHYAYDIIKTLEQLNEKNSNKESK